MLILQPQCAVWFDDEEDTAPNFWDYSHLTEGDPLPIPKETKAEKAQLLLF
jgi:hypothetical protein